MDVPVAEIAEALSTAEVSPGRMEVLTTEDGIRVVNDAYNANPTSMAAALRAARLMSGSGRCIAVLGHMAELGAIAPEEHERIGALLVRIGVDALVAVGPAAGAIAVAAEHEGLDRDQIRLVDDPGQASEAVRALARRGDLVLVKASRVDRLERVVDALGATTGKEATAWSPS